MPDKEPSEKYASRFKSLQKKRERIWTKLQLCYDLLPQLPQKINIFKVRAAQLGNIQNDYEEVLESLDDLSAVHSDLVVDTVKYGTAFDELYYEIIAKLEEINNSPSNSDITQIRTHLPEIKIPKFDGSYEKFSAFIALYDNLIHNSNLNDIDKFSYLLSYLEGSALKLIQTVVFAPANYKTAYDLLTKRFKNERNIANYYLSEILKLTPIKADNPQAIKTLVDIVQTNITSLKDLNIVDLADYILLEITLRLLDNRTRKIFESKYIDNVTFPTLKNLIDFLRQQCSVADIVNSNPFPNNKNKSSPSNHSGENERRRIFMAVQEPASIVCPLCKGDHKLIKCSSFLAGSPHSRYEIAKQHKRCYACLGTHSVSRCKSTYSCQKCGKKSHNTLLHFDVFSKQNAASTSTDVQPSRSQTPDVTTASVSFANTSLLCQNSYAILGTAQGHIQSSKGDWIRCRLVIDPGSQVNFITTRLAECLQLPRSKCPYSLKGIGRSSLVNTQGMVTCNLSSLFSTEKLVQFDAVVLPCISDNLPMVKLPSDIKNIFSHLRLADPHFDEAAPIDVLLGVQAALDVNPLQPSYIKGRPSAMLTSLGWVIVGSVDFLNAPLPSITSMHTHIDDYRSLDDNLRSFWESEEIPSTSHISPEDEMCENHFRQTVTRTQCGRYQTRLPFKDGIRPNLGSNREHALNRFLKLENRFKRDKEFHKLYADNLRDYINQGQLVPASSPSQYILTHHGVKKETSSGTSVRVVFNPTEKGSHGISLNDTLLSGPKLQADIGQVITRFRMRKIALTCDIRQMFRAISLHPDDCTYQHIFWRFSPEEPVQEWEHTRVIFGATSSPYLAQRTIIQLLEEKGSSFPLAAAALKHGTYIDDILWGADDEPTATELRNQLINLLNLGGFELGKWASSLPAIVDVGVNFSQKLPDSSSSLKVLGLSWNPSKDIFHYVIDTSNEIPSKRGILSRIARIYDVNGYLSPFVFSLKILLQQLWLQKVDWDAALPDAILDKWNCVTQELSLLEKISIPRCFFAPYFLNARLVGFSDASTYGMGAVIYIRLELSSSILVNLLVAKTRVAPLKTWTIPKLELGAAWLLSKLLHHIKPSFDEYRMDIPICYTDSMTTLAWINTSPHLLKTFVANRVAQIHEYSPQAQWRHVPGVENPADPASRGLLPSELLHCRLWWDGPSFLYRPIEDWPATTADCQSDVPELKETSLLSNLLVLDTTPFEALFERISSLTKLQRILAYILRFTYNFKLRKEQKNRRLGPLTGLEYRDALLLAARITQAQHLKNDILQLDKGHLCSKRYRSLSPFLDPCGLVMVGGRLKHSNLSHSSRHPILIPCESRFATLLVDHYHLYSGHGGPQSTQSLMHRYYWIPSARNLIRKRIFRCLTCYRFKAKPIQQPMADLPSFRIKPSRTFSHTGVDFAGPFHIKASLLRTTRTVKCYVSLFVCMVTKAVHLEAVSNLTTEGFLAAFDRFISRRGIPCHMYSDQGRNFRGAARELTETFQMMNNSNSQLTDYLALRHIEWTFNPPYAPNFGGIWEAGVKSFKHHFRRVVGEQVLSMEEFITVITRVEGILNSRPLCPLSTSPNDGFDYLTPGHFLIGGPMLSRPEHNVLDLTKNHLNRWQLTRHLIQSFWNRWSREYLHTQLFRPKWVSNPSHSFSEGDLVFWFAPGMPPTQWPKGRIMRLLPGADGIARVAKIKTPTGEILRPINKIVPLPSQ